MMSRQETLYIWKNVVRVKHLIYFKVSCVEQKFTLHHLTRITVLRGTTRNRQAKGQSQISSHE